ncbi:hypothetical protein [Streptomyces sp. NPDC006638]|uniref:hypothetical protein n=1 Tax=Streptomyces sp. NPDC006638 TaxID=3157183 RepID=UPI0033B9D3C0
MHTGTPAELRDKEQRAREIAQRIADLLNQLDAIFPGSTRAHGNRITGLAVTVTRGQGRWTASPA